MTKIFWSKWGGARASTEEKLVEWSCQSCGELQKHYMPEFFIENEFNEKFRVCGLCKNQSVVRKSASIQELIMLRQKGDVLLYVENLATLPIRW